MKPSVPLVVPLISFCIAAVSISVCHTCSPLGVMLLLYAVAFAVAVAVADTLRMLSILLFGVLMHVFSSTTFSPRISLSFTMN